MTDPVTLLGIPTRSTESLDQSYGRTYVQTHVERYSPSRDISPFVTRTRAYGIEVWS